MAPAPAETQTQFGASVLVDLCDRRCDQFTHLPVGCKALSEEDECFVKESVAV